MIFDPPARVLIRAAVFAVLSGGSAPARAADPNGIPLCTVANDQLGPVIVADGAGGAIVAWHDNRPTAAADGVCYAQRLNAAGVPQWSPDGVALSTTGDPGSPVIVSDGAGGAFVAYAGNNSSPRAQWVNAAGAPQWGADGAQLSVSTSTRDLAIAPDLSGSGGAIVAWREDNGAGGTSDVYAQKVNAAGTIQWGSFGVGVATTNMNGERFPALISDSAGGAIIVWINGTNGVRAQRLNSSGANQWANTPLSSAANNSVPAIVSDGAGGVFVAWAGDGTGPSIFAQRVSANGDRQWMPAVGGVSISSSGTLPTMIADRTGGATITWQDFRSGTNSNIYAQRVDGAGAVQWMPNGAEVCFFTNDQRSPTIVPDAGTGAIVSWYDSRSFATGSDIYAQRIDASGAQQWTPNGVPFCTAANNQEFPTVASDSAGGAWVTWQDFRSGTNYDIYAHHINGDGGALSVPSTNGATLMAAWPNPFFDRLQIGFVLPAAMLVRMRVFDVGGRTVRELGTAFMSGGYHRLTWDGRTSDGQPAGEGIYFLRVNGDGIATSRSVVRLK